MRLYELTNNNISKKNKTKQTVMENPLMPIMKKTERSIYGVDDHTSNSFKSHQKRNSAVYQKMKNWD